MFPGETAFKLYDTYGFPLDLTQDALKPRGITVDTTAFDAAMEKQKEEARKAWKGSGEAATETRLVRGPERAGRHRFPGLRHGDRRGRDPRHPEATARRSRSLEDGEEAALVLNQTPFYGESGGQVGDEGIIKGAKGALFRVTDTQKKLGDVFVHVGRVESGRLQARRRRRAGRRSCAALGHARQPLRHPSPARGACARCSATHVAQKGSLVAPDRLRFDFSHTKPMTPEELAAVEAMANAFVLQNSPVETRLMALEDAQRDAARMALFGEKYGEEVRVVSMGDAGRRGSVRV